MITLAQINEEIKELLETRQCPKCSISKLHYEETRIADFNGFGIRQYIRFKCYNCLYVDKVFNNMSQSSMAGGERYK